MNAVAIGATLAAALLGVANAVVTRSLWASPLFERSQKVAQTILIWLVPLSFLVVRHLIDDTDRRDTTTDPTVNNANNVNYDLTGAHHGHGGDDGFS